MLPHINAQQRHQTCEPKSQDNALRHPLYSDKTNGLRLLTCGRLQWVLIEACSNLDLFGLLVEAQPAPARALYGHRCRCELLFEVVETTEGGIQLGRQFARWLRLLGRQVLPENRVVDVAAAVELQCTLQSDDLRRIVLCDGLLQLRLGRIEVGDVGLMMLRVMQLHDFAGDDWLECLVVIVECGQRVFAGYLLAAGQKAAASAHSRTWFANG